MNRTTIIILLYSLTLFSSCRTESGPDFNFGFEKINGKDQLPDKWLKWGTSGYDLKVDSSEKHSGSFSILIESAEYPVAGSFGCIAFSIPAVYAGKNIELRAFMKLQNVEDGQIGLMLRIDGENGGLEFDNMQHKAINGTSDWKQYSVKLPLPDEAKVIYIGALLSGTGKLWVDDFQLLIDGKSLSKANPKKLQTKNADVDNEFDKGSDITNINLSPSKIEDLVLLGKIWGFLKYYHPAIAEGEFNWDNELFRILPRIIKSENRNERNKILLAWTLNPGEVKRGHHIKIDSSIVKAFPDLDWITDSSMLGEELAQQLIRIRDAKRDNKHYYIAFVPNVGNPKFLNEKPYSNILLKDDAGFRLLALYRYWNIIQYYFPYKNLIDENWNDVLAEYIPEFINITGEFDYKLAVLSLIARIHDTHANIPGEDLPLQTFKGINYAPAEVKFIENKPVVTGNLGVSHDEKSGLKKGDIILSINSKNIDEIIKERLPLTPASNFSTQLRDIAADLLRTNDSILDISCQRKNRITHLKIKCFPARISGFSDKESRKDSCFKLLTPKIACLYPGSIKNDYLPRIMEEVKKTTGLIIDLRCYPSDFIVFTLGRYLMPDPVEFVKFSRTSFASPGLFTYTAPMKTGISNIDYYKGKVVIIVNEITQSQAEYTAMALRVAPAAKVIGSTTAGADGNVSAFYLPGGIRTLISGVGVYYPDGRETQRVGIIPDIEVKPTIKGIMEGRDELLEKAIAIINAK